MTSKQKLCLSAVAIIALAIFGRSMLLNAIESGVEDGVRNGVKKALKDVKIFRDTVEPQQN